MISVGAPFPRARFDRDRDAIREESIPGAIVWFGACSSLGSPYGGEMTTQAIARYETSLRRKANREPKAASRDPRPLLRRASSLGWFSVGLGLAELLAPGGLARL